MVNYQFYVKLLCVLICDKKVCRSWCSFHRSNVMRCWADMKYIRKHFYWQIRAFNIAFTLRTNWLLPVANHNGNILFTRMDYYYFFVHPGIEKKWIASNRSYTANDVFALLLHYFHPNKLTKQFNNFVYITLWLLFIICIVYVYVVYVCVLTTG